MSDGDGSHPPGPTSVPGAHEGDAPAQAQPQAHAHDGPASPAAAVPDARVSSESNEIGDEIEIERGDNENERQTSLANDSQPQSQASLDAQSPPPEQSHSEHTSLTDQIQTDPAHQPEHQPQATSSSDPTIARADALTGAASTEPEPTQTSQPESAQPAQPTPPAQPTEAASATASPKAAPHAAELASPSDNPEPTDSDAEMRSPASATLTPATRPPTSRTSSLGTLGTLGLGAPGPTPAPGSAPLPGAPAKPTSLRTAPGLEEFDPFATPARGEGESTPAPGPRRREGQGRGGKGGDGRDGGEERPRRSAQNRQSANASPNRSHSGSHNGSRGSHNASPNRSHSGSSSGAPEPAPTSRAPPPAPIHAPRPGLAPTPGLPTPRTPGGSVSVGQGGVTIHRAPQTAGTDAEPPFNFAGFLKDLRSKPADPIARYLKSFLTNFAKKPFTVNEQVKLIRDFLAFIGEKMSTVEPWRSQSEAEFDNALEAMEKLVMNRLYPYTFTPQLTDGQKITTDDLERDAVFSQRVRLFRWVRERHLDVPEGDAAQGFLGFAEQELLKINHYKAPRDKMICILNSCKVIFGLIRHTAGADATSADAFIPILIFVVLRASPDNMISNVEYISRFRNPEKLQGEAGYYLSSLSGAIAFIETMDASSLSNITQEEFERNVERAIQELPVSPSSPRAKSSAPDMSPFAQLPGEEPARALALPATAAALDGTRRFFQRTGDAAKEAVSRPLSAIGKIFEDMRTTADGSESGDEHEDGGPVVSRWGGRHTPDPERGHPIPNPNPNPAILPGPHPHGLGMSPGSASASASPHAQQQNYSPHTPYTPQYQQGLSPGYTPGVPIPATPSRAEPPSRLLAQLGLSPAGSEGNTPREPTPDYLQHQMQTQLEASHEAYAREQARAASVLTLHQMFPALDEEIVDAVLYSCGDDLGVAIDRLLEM